MQADALTELNLSVRVDDSTGSIGRRYARTDEIAIPFGITLDFDNKPHTVTLQERDSTDQVRISMDVVPETVSKLASGKLTWDEVKEKCSKFTGQETTSES